MHFGVHLCVVALGIGIDGTKLPLGLAEGSTESTSVVTDLLTGLRDRGLDTSRAIFVGIDGGKALRAAVVQVFEHPVIARCQLHKIRNVADKLPDHLASTVTKRMRKDYHADSALAAEAQLEALAKELERTHPGAAGSLREGMAETLTVLRLDLPPTLARTLRSTNAIWLFESSRRSRRCFPDWCSARRALTLNAIDAERLSWTRSVGLAA